MAVNLALNYKWAGGAMIDTSNAEALQLGYVNLDATFNYIFQTTGAVQPYIEGGGYGAYLVNTNLMVVNDNGDVTDTEVKIGTSSDDHVVPYDIGLTCIPKELEIRVGLF